MFIVYGISLDRFQATALLNILKVCTLYCSYTHQDKNTQFVNQISCILHFTKFAHLVPSLPIRFQPIYQISAFRKEHHSKTMENESMCQDYSAFPEGDSNTERKQGTVAWIILSKMSTCRRKMEPSGLDMESTSTKQEERSELA